MRSAFRPAVDALFTVARLQHHKIDATPERVHLFCYLASLLSLLDANGISEWGYSFAATPDGAPHSEDIDSALSTLTQIGVLARVLGPTGSPLYSLTSPEEEVRFGNFEEASRRKRFIYASADTTLFLPMGMIRNALSREPGLSTFALRRKPGLLLEPSAETDELLEQLKAVKEVAGPLSADLIVPAVGWLTFLSTPTNG